MCWYDIIYPYTRFPKPIYKSPPVITSTRQSKYRLMQKVELFQKTENRLNTLARFLRTVQSFTTPYQHCSFSASVDTISQIRRYTTMLALLNVRN